MNPPCLPLISPFLYGWRFPSFSWLIITLYSVPVIHPVQPALGPTPREGNPCPLACSPRSSPSSHHSCCSSHSSPLRQTRPHPPFIYLPVTFPVPFRLGLDQSVHRGPLLARDGSWEQAWASSRLKKVGQPCLAKGLSYFFHIGSLNLYQPSAFWNPPKKYSSTVTQPLSLSHLLHIATQHSKSIKWVEIHKQLFLLHHRNTLETGTDDGVSWLFCVNDYSHDTSVKTRECPVLVKISAWRKVTLGEEATPTERRSRSFAPLKPSRGVHDILMCGVASVSLGPAFGLYE